MPLQFAWAAVSGYCQHENAASAKHFGHHEHQHKAADADSASPDAVKAMGGDPDCAGCHAGSLVALPANAALAPLTHARQTAPHHPQHPAPPPPERLERPQWRSFA